MFKKTKVLVIGASGQLGYKLVQTLRNTYGEGNIIASDIVAPHGLLKEVPFEKLDIMQPDRIVEVIHKYRITQIYHLAALLSVQGENNPQQTWKVNMGGLFSILEIAAKQKLDKVFWPSSIATFGPSSPKYHTPQHTFMDPETAYGITKLAGERWCAYFFKKYGVDVRSIRYPGLIGHKTNPGSGATDYAIEIYTKAVHEKYFSCPLAADTSLPFLYIDDAIHATLTLMESPAENIKIRSSYNIASMSLSPADIAHEIKKHIPDFKIEYNIDLRQEIAVSWPRSIDGTIAQKEWAWLPKFDLEKTTVQMLEKQQPAYQVTNTQFASPPP